MIAATNQDIDAAVAAGHFREDLFMRLNGVTIDLPPLRERREEIPALTEFFLKKYAVQYNRPLIEISPPTLQALVEHDWPGNVRELENLAKRVVVLGNESGILKDLQHAAAVPRHRAATPPVSAPAAVSIDAALAGAALPARMGAPLAAAPVSHLARSVLIERHLTACRPRGGAGADLSHAPAHAVEPEGGSRNAGDQLQGPPLQNQGERPRQGFVVPDGE